MTDPASRSAGRAFGIAAILLAGILLGSAGCGSVTAKKSDGGTGGTHPDSSTDAPENHDSSSAKDMRMADARTTDASSHGGSGGSAAGGTSGGGGGSGGGAGGSGGGAGGSGGAVGGSGGGAGGSGGGTGGSGGAGECKSNGDCMLYTGLGSGCCGVCQPRTDPTPPPIQCLIACLTPLVTCGCVNQTCVGSTKQL